MDYLDVVGSWAQNLHLGSFGLYRHIYLWAGQISHMHDSESDMSHPMNKNEEYCESLKKIGINAEAKPLDADKVEQENYYSKHFTNSPAMVTNHGIIKLKGSNIDEVQIIQKG